MTMTHSWVWVALFFLGCYHGINPGMGWLFAVALGLQEKSSRAVFAALPPIAAGHLTSVCAVAAVAAILQRTLPQGWLQPSAAVVLFGFGVYRFVRARHVRWVGMRVGALGLFTWACIVATGHGAGLMLLPFLIAKPVTGSSMHMSTMNMPQENPSVGTWLGAIAVHTFGYIVVMTLVAWVVYERLGVKLLRTAWFNFDMLWAVALMVSGFLMLLI